MKYKIMTFGCQMNESDSERIAGILEEMGYTASDTPEGSDLVIFNTCCVRKSAESRIYGRIGAMKNIRKINPEMIIAVCGCMSQQKGAAEEIAKKFPFVDFVLGTHNINKLPEIIRSITHAKTHIEIADEFAGVHTGDVRQAHIGPVKRGDCVKAWVPIMYGCNNYCSYCIVPFVRGRERSRDPYDILNEINGLSASGYREITLLGQNVNSYGKELESGLDFTGLLELIDKEIKNVNSSSISGISRVRFMTSHPKDLSTRLVDVMRENKIICRHLHLPVQSGSDKILELMNRRYSREHYISLVQELRMEIPDIALTTDVIIGFPGESEDDFNETYKLFSEVRFDSAYIFNYSERKGTPAVNLPGQVTDDVKKKRFTALSRLQDSISKEINDKLMGKVLEVLAEGASRTDTGKLTGRTDSNKIVNFPGGRELTGQLVNVKIEKAGTWSLEGRLIQ